MRKRIFCIITFISMSIFLLTACNGISEAEATGAFNDMKIMKDGYQLTVHAQTPGHPTPEADFETSFDWQNTEQSETDVIIRYIFIKSSILKDYGTRDCVQGITIDDKDMLYIMDGENQIGLLYEISPELYLKIELQATNCFDCTSGDSIPFDGNMIELLENQDFLQAINFTVEKE